MAEIELIPDPGFDDPAAWPSNVAVSVSGSQMTVQPGYTISVQPISPVSAEVGVTYSWELDVAQISAVGTYFMTFGGVNFWTQPQVPGVYSGSFVATSTSVLQLIHFVGMNQAAIYNSLSITQVVAGPPVDIIPFNLRINRGKSEAAHIDKSRAEQVYISRGKSYNSYIDQQHDAAAYITTNPQFDPEL